MLVISILRVNSFFQVVKWMTRCLNCMKKKNLRAQSKWKCEKDIFCKYVCSVEWMSTWTWTSRQAVALQGKVCMEDSRLLRSQFNHYTIHFVCYNIHYQTSNTHPHYFLHCSSTHQMHLLSWWMIKNLLLHPTLWKVITGLECILMRVRQER